MVSFVKDDARRATTGIFGIGVRVAQTSGTCRCSSGGSAGTAAGGRGARATRLAFDSDHENVLAVKARQDRLDVAIGEMAAASEFTPLVRHLGCRRGIGTLTGFGSRP